MWLTPDGQKAAALRTARGLSRARLAAETGLSESTLKKMESGQRVHPQSLKALADYFKVDAAHLLAPPATAPAQSPTAANPWIGKVWRDPVFSKVIGGILEKSIVALAIAGVGFGGWRIARWLGSSTEPT